VSKKILRHYPTLGVLRRHQPPTQEQFAPLVYAALTAGVSLDISSSKSLADSLDAAVRSDDPYFNKLLRILSTRCMMPAQYFCSGEIPKDQWRHYGLATQVYTHFTSPIRRYADIIVHRLLAASIGVIPLPSVNSDRAKQQDLCSHMNRRHKAAQYAQRASVKLHTLLYFKDRPSVESAYVLSISQDLVTVLVPRFGIESGIEIRSICDLLNASKSRFDAKTCSVTIEDDTTSLLLLSLQVFQQVMVAIKVDESRTGSRKLSVRLVLGDRNPSESRVSAATLCHSDDAMADDETTGKKTSSKSKRKELVEVQVSASSKIVEEEQTGKKKRQKLRGYEN
jgi:exoribonuclease R